MKESPLVLSIIAPIYGVEQYIGKFAESVLSQSYPYIEYIFVNDGTKDNSIEVLESIINEKYAHRREWIKIIHKTNGGLPAARAEIPNALAWRCCAEKSRRRCPR